MILALLIDKIMAKFNNYYISSDETESGSTKNKGPYVVFLN